MITYFSIPDTRGSLVREVGSNPAMYLRIREGGLCTQVGGLWVDDCAATMDQVHLDDPLALLVAWDGGYAATTLLPREELVPYFGGGPEIHNLSPAEWAELCLVCPTTHAALYTLYHERILPG